MIPGRQAQVGYTSSLITTTKKYLCFVCDLFVYWTVFVALLGRLFVSDIHAVLDECT